MRSIGLILILVVVSVGMSVSNQPLIAQNPPPPGSPEDKAHMEQVFARANVEFLVTNQMDRLVNSGALPNLANLLLENDDVVGDLGLLEEQRAEIKTACEKFSRVKADLDEQLLKAETAKDEKVIDEIRQKARDAERAFGTDISKVLVPDQINRLSGHDFSRVGPISFVVAPGVAKKLDLTPAQIEKINSRREKLANRIVEFSDSMRREARETVFDVLTESQQKQLLEMVPEEKLQSYFENVAIDGIYSSCVYDITRPILESHCVRIPPTELSKTKVIK
jgi:hypothetical protein